MQNTDNDTKLLTKLFKLQRESLVLKDRSAQIPGKGGTRNLYFVSTRNWYDTCLPLLKELNLYPSWAVSALAGGDVVLITSVITDLDTGAYVTCQIPYRMTGNFQNDGAAFAYWKRVGLLTVAGLIPVAEEDVSVEEHYLPKTAAAPKSKPSFEEPLY